ncbi:unnamed protein product [Meloidogyne enterolobii]|uniref:Uncharacterized protein n=1 Tax=Meloidogyne enterolobii TaxID=390850 RepID=A0ACB1B489_MELEN
MSFSLRKFFRLAKQQQNDLINGRQQSIQICEGGFFLLPDRLGQQSHLSQNNILHKKYYDEIGVTGCSSISSNSSFGSPFKVIFLKFISKFLLSFSLSFPLLIFKFNIQKNILNNLFHPLVNI